METAKFCFLGFRVERVEFDLSEIVANPTFGIQFSPAGFYYKDKRLFELLLTFDAELNSKKIISIKSVSTFRFDSVRAEVPDYFYANSIAIIFPYLRAFVSTLSLQAGANPIVLPTLNLSSLEVDLRNNTQIQ